MNANSHHRNVFHRISENFCLNKYRSRNYNEYNTVFILMNDRHGHLGYPMNIRKIKYVSVCPLKELSM